MSARRLVVVAFALGACAFPPSFTPVGLSSEEPVDGGSVVGDPDGGGVLVTPCDATCARCLGDRCFVSGEGGVCHPAAGEPRCDAGLACIEGRCVARRCDDESCACPVACAGRCERGACVPASPGEACRASGAGPACVSGANCAQGACVTSAGPVTADLFLEALGTAACAREVRCGRWPASLADACEALDFPSARRFRTASESLAVAASGRAVFDPILAGACVNSIAAAPCAGDLPDACGRVFAGTLAEGAACTTDDACARGLYCRSADFTGLTCAGACAPRVPAFAACNGLDLCAEDTLCLGPVNDRICVQRHAPGRIGEPCAAARPPCVGSGLVCGPAGRCVAAKSEGEACAAGECADGLACLRAASGSRACRRPGAIGDECVDDEWCTAPGARVAAASCVAGRCAALPSSGAAVTGALPNRCDPLTSWNDEGTCRALVPLEGECTSNEACGVLTGRVCAFGFCREPVACE